MEQQLAQFTARQQAIVLDAIKVQLRYEPFRETRNRKPRRPNPLAPWELRVGELRIFYGEEPLIFTEKKRPVAMLVSLRKVDRESLALSTNPEFLRIIEAARQEIRAGQTTSLEEVERKLRRATPNKATALDRGHVAVRKKREKPRSGRGE